MSSVSTGILTLRDDNITLTLHSHKSQKTTCCGSPCSPEKSLVKKNFNYIKFELSIKNYETPPPPGKWKFQLRIGLRKFRVGFWKSGTNTPPSPHPEKKFGLQIWHPWKKLESRPPPSHPEKNCGLQIWHPWKSWESRPPPLPPPWEKISTSDLASLKKVGVQTPPPPWEKFWTSDLASLKKVGVQTPPPLPPPQCK